MTRINVVPPSELTDKHLLAEYRELPRVFGLAAKWYQRGRTMPLPHEYTLGQGHVMFFYNKLAFLMERHAALVAEMRQRGFTVQFPFPKTDGVPEELFCHYTPTRKARRINRERISQRLAEASQRAATRT